jgi:seryl-tRNA synthetase
MLDIKFVRENPEIVKENIKKKFQDQKLPLVDEVIEIDTKIRALKVEDENLKALRNTLSKQIGQLMREKKVEESNKIKEIVAKSNKRIAEIDPEIATLEEELKKRMMVIPNIVDASVPVGKDDSMNVENQKYAEPVVPPYEIPYHADIIAKFNGLDNEAAGRIPSGNGFYDLVGDIARLHSAMLTYVRDFMIDKGFTYCIPPFMIHSDVVNGVMAVAEMENMMYKIEGEDLCLIGIS